MRWDAWPFCKLNRPLASSGDRKLFVKTSGANPAGVARRFIRQPAGRTDLIVQLIATAAQVLIAMR